MPESSNMPALLAPLQPIQEGAGADTPVCPLEFTR